MARADRYEELAMIAYGPEPGILLLADTQAAEARGRQGIAAAGCRLIAANAPDRLEALDRVAGLDGVMVELDADFPALDPLLDRLEQGARDGRYRSVLSGPLALVDAITARVTHPDIAHLADPSDQERAAALAFAARPPGARLHDVGRPENAGLLQQLSEEVGRIANILANLSEEDGDLVGPSDADGEGEGEAVSALEVRAIIRARRLRDHFFKAELFADPAWDILLDLLAARLERSRVAVSSLCIAAAVPPTTALRWIKLLTDRGLLIRSADPEDGRRVYVDLSDAAADALAAYLRAARRLSPLAI